MSLVDAGLTRDLGEALVPDSPPGGAITRRRGTIAAVNAGSPRTVSVTVGATTITGVRLLDVVAVNVGDLVVVDFTGPDPLVIGSTGGAVSGVGGPVTLGYAEILANSAGFTAVTDIIGLSVTVTVPAGRRIRVSAKGSIAATSGTPGWGSIYIYESGAGKANWRIDTPLNVSEGAMPSVVLSPSAGTHTYYVRAECDTGTCVLAANGAEPAYILVEDITGNPAPYNPASVPAGALAYALVTANHAGISAETDVNGYSANVVVPAGRVLRITAQTYLTGTAANDVFEFNLKEGSNRISVTPWSVPTSGALGAVVTAVVSPSAGSHTYKATLQRSSGTGTVTANANANAVGYFLIEDITPTPAPANTAPSSTLAYAEQVPGTSGYTTETQVPLLSVSVTVPAGRRVRLSAFVPVSSSVAGDTVRVAIKEPAVAQPYLADGGTHLPVAGNIGESSPSTVISPTAGTHTYIVTVRRSSGSGTITVYGATTVFAYLLVEDVTGSTVAPAATPNGVSVYSSSSRPAGPWAGMVIYETDTTMLMVWNGTLWVPASPRSSVVLVTPGLAATGTFPALVGTLTVPAVTWPTHHHVEAQLLLGGGTTNDQFELGIYDGATTGGTLLRAIRWTNQLNTNVDQRDISFGFLDVAAGVAKTYTLWATRTAGAGTVAVTGDPRYSVFVANITAAG